MSIILSTLSSIPSNQMNGHYGVVMNPWQQDLLGRFWREIKKVIFSFHSIRINWTSFLIPNSLLLLIVPMNSDTLHCRKDSTISGRAMSVDAPPFVPSFATVLKKQHDTTALRKPVSYLESVMKTPSVSSSSFCKAEATQSSASSSLPATQTAFIQSQSTTSLPSSSVEDSDLLFLSKFSTQNHNPSSSSSSSVINKSTSNPPPVNSWAKVLASAPAATSTAKSSHGSQSVTPKSIPKKSKKNVDKDIKRRGLSGNSINTRRSVVCCNRPAPNTGFEVRRISFSVAASLLKLEPREDLDSLLRDNRLRVVLRIIPTERARHRNVKSDGTLIAPREVYTLVPAIKRHQPQQKLMEFVFEDGFRFNDFVDFELIQINRSDEHLLEGGSLSTQDVDECGVVEYRAYSYDAQSTTPNYDLYHEPTNKIVIQRTGARFEGVRIKKYQELAESHTPIPLASPF